MSQDDSQISGKFPNLRDVKAVQKKVLANRASGHEDWYRGMTLYEVSVLYKHAINGYLCSGQSFVYADTATLAFYVRVKLVVKYIRMLAEHRGRQAAASELEWLECGGWVYYEELHGQEVLCRSEGQGVVRAMNRGTYPENARNVHGWDRQYCKEHTLPKGVSKADAWLEMNPADPEPPFFRVLENPLPPTPAKYATVQLNLF